MPFKIIETIERGRRLITTVPSLWESDGNLYWPKKNAIMLKKNENSTPQLDWKLMSCLVVRDNLLDYQTAEQEIAMMSDATETDDKENEPRARKCLVPFNLNNLAKECIRQSEVAEEVSPAVVEDEDAYSVIIAEGSSSAILAEDPLSTLTAESNVPIDAGHILIQNTSQENTCSSLLVPDVQNVNMSQPDKDLIMPNLEHFDPQVLDLDATATESIKVPHQIGLIMEMLSAVQQNQKLMFDNQQKILKGLALLNTKFEEFVTRSQGTFQQERLENSLRFKMITNIEELSNIEELLKDLLMEKKYFEELSIICTDKKTGINNAYTLVDTMFDRQFMTRCSWGGGTKGEPKHCFKAFPNTIALFLKVIHEYDKTFTKPICEDFFKNVMRHSTKRNTAKRQRNSTTKRKTKKTKANSAMQEEIAGPSSVSNPTQ